jgi:predicted phage terminase large subunit-like protein
MLPPNIDLPEVVRAARIERERRKCIASLRHFLEHVWTSIPLVGRELIPSVAIDGLCAAFQAVVDGRIRRLGVACPPGVSKSVVGVVVLPAWLELRTDGKARVMCGSYSDSFAERDAIRCRDLIESERFRELCADRWSIRKDVNRIHDFWFSSGGRRLTVSPKGRSIGERCTFQIVDDALSSGSVHSQADKDAARNWVSVALTSRLEDQDNDPRIIIGQRLTHDDPMQWAIDRGWRILDLPAVMSEADTPCILLDDAGVEVWRDPRRPGEPLSTLLSTDALTALKIDMGSAAFSAQYLQRPYAEDATFFRRAWFGRRYTNTPQTEREVIALDASYKAGDSSDFAVIQAWGADGDDRYLLEQWRRQAGFVDTLAALRGFRDRHPSARVLVEAAANGHAVIDQLERELGRGVVEAVPTTGGKAAKWAAASPICERGSVVLPEHAPWLEPWLDEITRVPAVEHDDQADAMSIALLALDDRGAAWPDYTAIRRDMRRGR